MNNDSYQINAIVGLSNSTGNIGAAISRQKALTFSDSFANVESKTNLSMRLSKASAGDIIAGIDENKIITPAALAAAGVGGSGVTDHGLLTGLGDDDHEQYFLSDGRGNGQMLVGGVNPGGNLTLQSTNNATRGNIYVNDTMVTNDDVTVNGGITVTDYISAGNVISTGSATVADLTVNNGYITTNTGNNITLDPNGAGNVSFSGKRAINGAMPVDPNDLATKEYVDNNELVVGALTGMLAPSVTIASGEINIDATKFTDIGTTGGADVSIGAIGQQLLVLANNANFANVTVHGSLYGGINNDELLPIRATSAVANNGTVQIMTETEAVSLLGNGAALHVAGGVAIAKKLIVGDEITTNRLDGPDDINLVLHPKGAGSIDVSGSQIIGVLAPTTNNHAATKEYVDTAALQRYPVKYAVDINSIVNLFADGIILRDVGTNNIAVYFPGASVSDRVAVYGADSRVGIYTVTDASPIDWYLTRIEIPLAGYTYDVTFTSTKVTYLASTNGVILNFPDTNVLGQNNTESFALTDNVYTIDPRHFSSIGGLTDTVTINPSTTVDITTQDVYISSTGGTRINTTDNGPVLIGANSTNGQVITIRAGTDTNGQVLLSGNKVLCDAAVTQPTSIVTKEYADAIAQGFGPKLAVRAKTTDADIAFINNQLTNTNGPLVVDGITLAATERILIAGSAPSAFYGIYRVVSNGAIWVITRSSDADNTPSTGEVTRGIYTLVQEGATHATQGWALVNYPGEDLGVSLQTWSQVTATGSGVTDVTVSGSGLSVSGTSVKNITIDATQFTNIANSGTATITGVVTPVAANDAVPKTYVDTKSIAGDVGGTIAASTIAAGVVTGKVLTGYLASTGAVSASDTILSAIGKLAGNIGTGTAGYIPYFTGTNALGTESGLQYNSTTDTLAATNIASAAINSVTVGAITSASVGTSLAVGSSLTVGTSLGVTGTSTLGVTNTGNMSVTGTLNVTGNTVIGGGGSTNVSINNGSSGGTVNIGTNAGITAINLGTGTTTGQLAIGQSQIAVNINSGGTGGVNINFSNGGASTFIAAGSTTGDVRIGGTSNNVNIKETGTGGNVNIATNNTGSTAVNIANGGTSGAVNIGGAGNNILIKSGATGGSITLANNAGTCSTSIGTGNTTGTIALGGFGLNQNVSIRSGVTVAGAFGTLAIGSNVANVTSGTINIGNDAAAIATNIGTGTTTGDVVIGSDNNLAKCLSAITDPKSITTKEYVDSVAQGFGPKLSCRVKTTLAEADAIISSGHNFVGTGSNKTISKTGFGAIVFDGINDLAVNDRVLFAGGTNSSEHYGIYRITNVGGVSTSWSMIRAEDANDAPSAGEVSIGIYTFITEGTVHNKQGWSLASYGGTLDNSTSGLQLWSQTTAAGGISNITTAVSGGQSVSTGFTSSGGTTPVLTINPTLFDRFGSTTRNSYLEGQNVYISGNGGGTYIGNLAGTIRIKSDLDGGNTNRSTIKIGSDLSNYIEGEIFINNNSGNIATYIGSGTTTGDINIGTGRTNGNINIATGVSNGTDLNIGTNLTTTRMYGSYEFRNSNNEVIFETDTFGNLLLEKVKNPESAFGGVNARYVNKAIYVKRFVKYAVDTTLFATSSKNGGSIIPPVSNTQTLNDYLGITPLLAVNDLIFVYGTSDKVGAYYIGDISANWDLTQIDLDFYDDGADLVGITYYVEYDKSVHTILSGVKGANEIVSSGLLTVNYTTAGAENVGSFINNGSGNVVLDPRKFDTIGTTASGIVTIGGGSHNITMNPLANVNLSGKKITNLAMPSLISDAANKEYVDAVAQGFGPKLSCRVKTTLAEADAILASGYTFGGTDSSKTITNDNPGVISFDGINDLAVDDRVLFAGGTASSHHYGIYRITSVGGVASSWSMIRAEDANDAPAIGEISTGIYTFITEGTNHNKQGWSLASYGGTLDSATTGLQLWTQTTAASGISDIQVSGAGLSVTPSGVSRTITIDATAFTNLSASGTVNLNVSAGSAITSIGTGTTNGAVTIGGGNTTQAITLRSGSGGVNINTLGVGPITLGNGTGVVALNAPNPSAANHIITKNYVDTFNILGDVTGTLGSTVLSSVTVTSKLLTNLFAASSTGPINDTDSILNAFRKLQNTKISGDGFIGYVPFYGTTSSLTNKPNFTFDTGSNILSVPTIKLIGSTSNVELDSAGFGLYTPIIRSSFVTLFINHDNNTKTTSIGTGSTTGTVTIGGTGASQSIDIKSQNSGAPSINFGDIRIASSNTIFTAGTLSLGSNNTNYVPTINVGSFNTFSGTGDVNVTVNAAATNTNIGTGSTTGSVILGNSTNLALCNAPVTNTASIATKNYVDTATVAEYLTTSTYYSGVISTTIRETIISNTFYDNAIYNLANGTTNATKIISLTPGSYNVEINTSTQRFFMTTDDPMLELIYTNSAWSRKFFVIPKNFETELSIVNVDGVEITTTAALIGRAIDTDEFGDIVAVTDTANIALLVFQRNGRVLRNLGNTSLSAGTNTVSMNFGASVAVSRCGKYIVAGSPNDPNGGTNNGSASLCVRQSNGAYGESVRLRQTSTTSFQGMSVAISNEGKMVAVGAPGNGASGGVYIYRKTGGVSPTIVDSWALVNNLVISGATGDQFGSSVALSDDGQKLVVGCLGTGAFKYFVYNGTTFVQSGGTFIGSGAIGSASQGYSISMSYDGIYVAIGGYGDNTGVGAVWIWKFNGTTWIQQQKIVPDGNTGASEFGISVKLNKDGTTIVIGGYNDGVSNSPGASWIYNRAVGFETWTVNGTKLIGSGSSGDPSQGRGVTISGNGNRAFIGGPFDGANSTGAFWEFARNENTNIWAQQGLKIKAKVYNPFPGGAKNGVMSGDGKTFAACAGNTNEGRIAIFVKIGGIWVEQNNSLNLITSFGSAAAGNGWGASMALSYDGNTLAIGATSTTLQANGVVVIAVRNPTTFVWSFQYDMGANGQITGGVRGGIGTSVALSANGNRLVIGGPTGNSGAGGVYVWNRSGTTWTQQGDHLVAIDEVGTTGALGSRVQISADGETVAATSPGDDANAGSIYVFKRELIGSTNTWTQSAPKIINLGGGIMGSIAASTMTGFSLSGDGKVIAVGHSTYPGVSIFNLINGAWVMQNKPVSFIGTAVSTTQKQGAALKLNYYGNVLLVGAPSYNSGDGAAYVFTTNNRKAFRLAHIITPEYGATASNFGTVVSMDDDAKTFCIANNSNYSGAARGVWFYS